MKQAVWERERGQESDHARSSRAPFRRWREIGKCSEDVLLIRGSFVPNVEATRSCSRIPTESVLSSRNGTDAAGAKPSGKRVTTLSTLPEQRTLPSGHGINGDISGGQRTEDPSSHRPVRPATSA